MQWVWLGQSLCGMLDELVMIVHYLIWYNETKTDFTLLCRP